MGSLRTWLENYKKRVIKEVFDVFSWLTSKSNTKLQNKRYFAIQGTIFYQVSDNSSIDETRQPMVASNYFSFHLTIVNI